MKAILTVTVLVLGCTVSGLSRTAEVPVTKEFLEMMKALMIETRVVLVAELEGRAEDYASDDDPMTLQVVTLSKRLGENSHVSADGEVIFMNSNTEGEDQQKLITTAFYRKAKRKIAEPQMSLQSRWAFNGTRAEGYSIDLVSIDPAPGTPLIAGTSVEFRLC